MDKVNASSAPPKIPGASTGSVTSKKVTSLFAPRSILASSMELSYPASLALTLNMTNGTQKVTCASIRVSIPLGILTLANIVSREIPSTISGITTGIYKSPSIIAFPLNLYRYIPIAPRVPMIVASMVLTTAMIMVFPNASSKEVLSHSFTYQSRVKPFQLIYGFVVVALKEFTTITDMGRNRNR